MSLLSSTLLLDAPLVRVSAVSCRSPRRGPGPEEGGEPGLELVVPRRGVFRVHGAGEEITADPNSVLVLGAGVDRRVSHPADGGDECTSLALAPELAEEALGRAPRRHGIASPAAQLGAAVVTAQLERGVLSGLAADEAVLALVGELAPSLAGTPPPAPRPSGRARARVEEVRALLAAEPAAAWRIDAVAQAVHSSPFHLARLFRAATGETIARYLMRLRLAAALERIAAGERSLGRLAVELGFAHHSHLSARFRAGFGLTPSDARKIVTAAAAPGA